MNWMESLGLTLLHFMWQGLLIGVIAAIVNKVLKKPQRMPATWPPVARWL